MKDASLRPGRPADAPTIAALATQVFLDTYAPEGIAPHLAVEALEVCSLDAFSRRIAEPRRAFLLAERGEGLVGFAEILVDPFPVPGAGRNATGAELVRLYVQPGAQGGGLGALLLTAAEHRAAEAGLPSLWLTAWDGNARARAFYARCGYTDVGTTDYTFQGRSYVNRVLVKHLRAA